MRIWVQMIGLSCLASLLACQDKAQVSPLLAIVSTEQTFEVLAASDPLHQLVGSLENEQVMGTAFRLDSQLLLTNFHLTGTCSYQFCDLLFQGRYAVRLLARRIQPDLALLELSEPAASNEGDGLHLADQDTFQGRYDIVQSFQDSRAGAELRSTSGEILEREVRPYWDDLVYRANTVAGSSGSPILNEQRQLVGIHKAYAADRDLNLGTSLMNQSRFLEQDLVGEAAAMLAQYEDQDDGAIKYDLAEVLLQALEQNPVAARKIEAAYRACKRSKSLLFYLSQLRKIPLASVPADSEPSGVARVVKVGP